jgi:hypothetical protein
MYEQVATGRLDWQTPWMVLVLLLLLLQPLQPPFKEEESVPLTADRVVIACVLGIS